MSLRFPLLFVLFGTLFLNGFAQPDSHKVTLHDFSADPLHSDWDGRKGLSLKFKLRMHWVNQARKHGRYDLTWRLEDAKGKTIYNSKSQKEYKSSPKKVSVYPPAGGKSNYMESRNVELEMPYSTLQLPPGEQEISIIFSVKDRENDLKDVVRKSFRIEKQDATEYAFSEQTFEVEDLKFYAKEEGFAVKGPGISMRFNLRPRYPQLNSAAAGYEIFWLFRDRNGQVVFDSRQTASVHHRSEKVYFRNLKDGAFTHLSCFSRYDDIRLPGPGSYQVVLLARELKGTPKEIYAEFHDLDLPVKFPFSDQEFTVQNLESKATVRKGVSGLAIQAQVTFAKTGPRLDPEKGDYFIYPEIRDQGGNVLFSEKPLDAKQKVSSLTCQSFPAFEAKGPQRVEFFIPWYRLKLPKGRAFLQFSLRASDQKQQVRFPVIAKGGRVAQAPALRQYKVHLTSLLMHTGDYDVEFLKTGTSRPDLQWTLLIGQDVAYVSPMKKNSLIALPGKVEITLAENDRLSIVLYDVDSGFFNRDDFLGDWEIPYMVQPNDFVFRHENEENLEKLEVEIKRLD